MTIDPTYKTDNRKIEYHQPKTNVSWLIQQPEYKIDGLALTNAYMADWREERKKC